jgi:hypothetical protein
MDHGIVVGTVGSKVGILEKWLNTKTGNINKEVA